MDIADGLAGHKGGFVGIRFSNDEDGRGVNGASLEDPIPYDRRVIKVGVGKWYRRKDEIKELFVEGSKVHTNPWLETFDIDDWGQKLDKKGRIVPLPKPKPFERFNPNDLLPAHLAVKKGEYVFKKRYEFWTPHPSQMKGQNVVDGSAAVANAEAEEVGMMEDEDEDEAEFERDEFDDVGEGREEKSQVALAKRQNWVAERAANRLKRQRAEYLAEHHSDKIAGVMAQYNCGVMHT